MPEIRLFDGLKIKFPSKSIISLNERVYLDFHPTLTPFLVIVSKYAPKFELNAILAVPYLITELEVLIKQRA